MLTLKLSQTIGYASLIGSIQDPQDDNVLTQTVIDETIWPLNHLKNNPHIFVNQPKSIVQLALIHLQHKIVSKCRTWLFMTGFSKHLSNALPFSGISLGWIFLGFGINSNQLIYHNINTDRPIRQCFTCWITWWTFGLYLFIHYSLVFRCIWSFLVA